MPLDDLLWRVLAQRAVHTGQDGKLSTFYVDLDHVRRADPSLVDQMVDGFHLGHDDSCVRIMPRVVSETCHQVVVEVGKWLLRYVVSQRYLERLERTGGVDA